MPASTSETAARLESSIGVSIFSDATAFIGRSLFRVDDASADVPRTTKGLGGPIHPADFDHIAAGLRQCGCDSRAPRAHKPATSSRRTPGPIRRVFSI